MRGFNRTVTVMCATLILESTLSGWTKGFACAEYRVQGFFWAPPATDGAFCFFFLPTCSPAVPLWKRTQGSCGISGPIWHLILSRDW